MAPLLHYAHFVTKGGERSFAAHSTEVRQADKRTTEGLISPAEFFAVFTQ